MSRRGQLGRLRRLGQSALLSFGLDRARLTPLRHQHNTTFKVEADGGPYVLRINRPGVHTIATIGSEMTWLAALRRETDLGVPEPVAAPNGSPVVLASDLGVPEPRACVLFGWLEGRFVNDRLTPGHLAQVGAFEADLQIHTEGWMPPMGFARPRVGTLTTYARRNSVAGSAAAALSGDHPTREDADQGLHMVAELMSAADGAVFATGLEVVWATTRELETQPHTFGLIHGDLHYENFLFHAGRVWAIDFDDCGWGFFLYDLAVTLWELEGRSQYQEMRAALLDEYSRLRPLPVHHTAHLLAFTILRRMQILMWVLESREHAAFRDDWRTWARDELEGLRAVIPS